jgi:hypothetical protein
MQVSLRISSSAAAFIKKMFERQSEEMALVVTGVVGGTLRTWDSERPLQEIVKAGSKLASNLPSKIMVEYVIGTKEVDRLPEKDIHVVNGIKCYLPDQIIELIGSREIILEGGMLRFEPRLGPREIERNI